MSLHGLLTWIRVKRRGSTQPQDEPGVVISTRLKELLQIKKPNPVEIASMQCQSEDNQNEMNRDKSEYSH
jgi:hypothetical protein